MAGKGLVRANYRPRCIPPATTFSSGEQSAPPTGALAGGIDIVDLDRLTIAIRRTGSGFIDRVLHPDEHEFVATPAHSIDVNRFAILFGAKESAVKVLRGLPTGSTLRDITVSRPPVAGPNELTVHGAVREWAVRKGIRMFATAVPISDRALLTWVIATPANDPLPPQVPGASL